MTFALTKEESLSSGLPRIALGQLRLAMAVLGDQSLDAAAAVHDARKACKRFRALLRLCRQALGEATFAAENAAVRDLALQLAKFRDADALLEALAGLSERRSKPKHAQSKMQGAAYEAELPGAEVVKTRILQRHGELQQRYGAEVSASRRRVAAGLTALLEHVPKWQLPAKLARPLAGELQKALRRARRSLRDAKTVTNRESLHEWRKQVKHCWYMSSILAVVWTRFGAPAQHKLERLGDLLGDYQDLALLDDFVARQVEPWPSDFNVARFRALIARRQQRLVIKAFSMGAKVLAAKPDRPRRVIAKTWPKGRETDAPQTATAAILQTAKSGAKAAASGVRKISGAYRAGPPRLVRDRTNPQSH